MADHTNGRNYPEPRFDSFVSKATSRRQFIKGVIFSGAAASGAGYLLSLGGCSSGGGSAAGVERLLTLNVNGQMRPVDVAPNETLAMTLRYKLSLTGTKLGCVRGECGACTVLIDGVSSYSCSTLTHSVRGRAITTIEGLEGPNGELHKVQQAMIDELGPQCGFCTLGQIMAAPTRAQAEQELARFAADYGAKYPKAVDSLTRDQEALLAFYDFPAEHWLHIRTSNPIESSFATVRLRQRITKGPGSKQRGLLMAYKLLAMASERWRRLNAAQLLPLVRAGVQFMDGKQPERHVEEVEKTPEDAAA